MLKGATQQVSNCLTLPPFLDTGSSYIDAAMHQPFKLTNTTRPLINKGKVMVMIYDGAAPSNKVTLKLKLTPHNKYLAKNSSGKRKLKTKGYIISFVHTVYDTVKKKDIEKQVFTVDHGFSTYDCQVNNLFVSEEQLSFLRLSGKDLVNGVIIEDVVNCDLFETSNIDIDFDDLLINESNGLLVINEYDVDRPAKYHVKKMVKVLDRV